MASASRIFVCVRKRPLNKQELKHGDADVVPCNSQQALTVLEPRVKYDLTKYTEKHPFMYDLVIDENRTNADVYARTARPLIDLVVDGGCATCFAYGQTGSGKTFTMMGGGDQKGLYILAAVDLFSRLAPGQQVFVSFFEIYAGKLFDLLNNRKKLFAREDAKQNVNIAGLTEHHVSSPQQLMDLVNAGAAERASGATAANADSSRSHGILQLAVKHKASDRAKLRFIDLAGSERGADTAHCDRQRRLEGADINKSLLALKECIRALALGSKHVPFRGSKLTSVLKDSFVGKSQAVMIAAISPASSNCEHTLNTLRYAYRVKEMKEPDDLGEGRAPAKRRGADRPPPQVLLDPPSPEDSLQEPDAEVDEPDGESAEVEIAHEKMMMSLVEEEEDVLQCHRAHVDAKMELVKQELQAMEQLDRGKMTVDDYVGRLDAVLAQEIQRINELRDRLGQFQNHLLEEEIMNTTIMQTRNKKREQQQHQKPRRAR